MVGGMMFVTGGVATTSCAFALHAIMNMTLPLAILLGAVWGAIVMTMDRVPVLSTRRWHRTRQPISFAAGLLTAASRLLPAADRARYAEEYQSELWELSQSAAGRVRQLQYAVRQLVSALPMGFVLRSPRHRSAAP